LSYAPFLNCFCNGPEAVNWAGSYIVTDWLRTSSIVTNEFGSCNVLRGSAVETR